MLQVSKVRSSLKSLRLLNFKLIISWLILIFCPRISIFLLIALYHLIDDRRNCLLYLVIGLYLFLRLNVTISSIDSGVVSQINDNYIIVDKPFYKVRLFTSEPIQYGDLIRYEASLENTKDLQKTSALRNRILQEGSLETFEVIRHNKSLRIMIRQYINTHFYPEVQNVLNKIFYGINDYDDEKISLLSSLGFYYCGMAVYRKFKKPHYILPLIGTHVLLFGLNDRMGLLLGIILADHLGKSKIERFNYLSFLVMIIYPYWLYNYGFLIPLLFRFWNLTNQNIDKSALILLIQSYFFHEISLFKTFFYRIYICLYSLFYILSLFLLIMPFWEGMYLNIIAFISGLLKYDPIVKGQLPWLMIILLYLMIRLAALKGMWQVLLLAGSLCFRLYVPYTGVHFIDVGQGDAILIHDAFLKHTILIDTGRSERYYQLDDYLSRLGIDKIDYLIITHADSDHDGNVQKLMEDYIISACIKEGTDIRLGDFFMDNLNYREYDNDNDNSLVYYLNIDDWRFLFTGDISQTCESDLIRYWGKFKIDVLKVAHHGSKTSSSPVFLQTLDPQLAIISTSGQYHHPAKETLDSLNKAGIATYITKEKGSIRFMYCLSGMFINDDRGDFGIIMKE